MNESNLNEITCRQEETERRVSFCMSCEKNILDIIPKCQECGCSISILTSMTFKICPIGKW